MAGLEPADEGVKVPCLTTWLHPNIIGWSSFEDGKDSNWEDSAFPSTSMNKKKEETVRAFRPGGPSGIRTRDRPVMSRLLSPTELKALRKGILLFLRLK